MKRLLPKSDSVRRLLLASATALAFAALTPAMSPESTSGFALSAYADQVAPVQITSISPASGSTVNKLSQLNLVLTGAVDPNVGYDFVSGYTAVSVTNEAGDEVTTGGIRDAGSGPIIKLKSAITTAGKYTINVKAGSVWAIKLKDNGYETEKVEGTDIAACSFEYTVVDMAQVKIESASPENGSVLSQIKQLTLELSGGSPVFGIECAGKEYISIQNESNEEVAKASVANMNGKYIMKASPTVSDPGTYTITFKKGALYAIDGTYQPVIGTESATTTLTYTVVDLPAVTFVSADPENESKVNSLKTINTTWSGGEGLILANDTKTAPLLNASYDTVATGSFSKTDNGFAITLDSEVTTPGSYSITIPSGIIQAVTADNKPVNGNVNTNVKLTYEIVEAPKADPVQIVSITPASGSTVNKLSQLNLVITGAVDPNVGYDFVSGYTAVSVTNEAGDEVTTGGIRDAGSGPIIKLKSAITTAGKYTINVKAGSVWAIKLKDNGYETEKVEGTDIAACSFEYTVVDMAQVKIESASPENGSVLSQIKQLTLELSGGSPVFGIECAGKEYISIQNESNEEVAKASVANMNGKYIMKASPTVSDPGTYTITFKKGALYAIDGTYQPVIGTESATTTLTYTVVDLPAVTFVSADPENESKVNSLKTINTTWSGGEGLILANDTKTAPLLNASYDTVATGSFSKTDNGFAITLDSEVTTPGSYSITIPSGIIQAVTADNKPVNGNVNTNVKLTYEIVEAPKADPVQIVSITPASGSTVNKLSQFNIELSGEAINPAIGCESVSGYEGVSLKDASGEVVTGGSIRNMPTGYVIKLKDAVTASGAYTLTVNKGAIWAMSADGNDMTKVEGSEIEECSFTYTVVDMPKVEFVSANPASGSIMQSLKQINLELTGGDPVVGIEFAGSEFVTIENENNETIANANIRNMNDKYILKPTTEITDPGTYTITVKAGALFGMDKTMTKVEGTENAKFTISYTIVDSPVVTFVSADPADNSKVATLKTINTVWTGGESLALADESKTISVFNSDYETVATAALSKTEDGFTLTLDKEITTSGTYTITINEGMIQAVTADAKPIIGNVNSTVKLTYEVDETLAVSAVYTDGADITVKANKVIVTGFDAPVIEVYDMSGALLKSVKADETELTNGLYIIKAADATHMAVRRVMIKAGSIN
ncbi:MAG: hypothetical protein NC356_02290 [Ruminococcus sp.]|nr:hypothetical protein [Ruminococcus sp.]